MDWALACGEIARNRNLSLETLVVAGSDDESCRRFLLFIYYQGDANNRHNSEEQHGKRHYVAYVRGRNFFKWAHWRPADVFKTLAQKVDTAT